MLAGTFRSRHREQLQLGCGAGRFGTGVTAHAIEQIVDRPRGIGRSLIAESHQFGVDPDVAGIVIQQVDERSHRCYRAEIEVTAHNLEKRIAKKLDVLLTFLFSDVLSPHATNLPKCDTFIPRTPARRASMGTFHEFT